ncbi:hypothetical protein RRG08_030920 [Elysia crispata]|uniref:Uncharacterized protein n=1 Tax=Elysia crispata TaxID=231223 RepID=A0AAE1AA51_9GAST|nr:hypothetical protein RRG08_030920 [Elysia crispata]
MPHMTIIATSAAGVLFTQPPLVVGRSAPLCPLNPTRLSPRSPNRSPLAAMGGVKTQRVKTFTLHELWQAGQPSGGAVTQRNDAIGGVINRPASSSSAFPSTSSLVVKKKTKQTKTRCSLVTPD